MLKIISEGTAVMQEAFLATGESRFVVEVDCSSESGVQHLPRLSDTGCQNDASRKKCRLVSLRWDSDICLSWFTCGEHSA